MLEFEFSSSMRGIHILGRQNTDTNKIIENVYSELSTEGGYSIQHPSEKNLGKNFRSFLVTVCKYVARVCCVLSIVDCWNIAFIPSCSDKATTVMRRHLYPYKDGC